MVSGGVVECSVVSDVVDGVVWWSSVVSGVV